MSMERENQLTLSPEAIRALGVLLEKEKTTPDNYPLTLNSLLSACNQSTNRNPVVSYDELTVERALTELRDEHLALRGVYAGSRVPKHRHCITDIFNLSQEAIAVLTVLLLRGEQTAGEIKSRTDRLCNFATLDDVDKAINELTSFTPPLVRKLERMPGHKEVRVMHLLACDTEVPATDEADIIRPAFQLIEGNKPDDLSAEDDNYFESQAELDLRVDQLEREVSVLTHEIMSLRAEIDALRDPSA